MLATYFLYLGTVGFGGPIALVERMRRDLQEERRWFTVDEFKEGLALAQLAPGPLAAQLAIYLGWLRGGLAGATLCGLAFIVPSFAIVLILSAAYIRFGGLTWIQDAFYGVGAAVIAVIAHSAWKLAQRTVAKSTLLWTIVAANAALTAWTEHELVTAFVVSGLLVLLARSRVPTAGTLALIDPSWLFTGVHGKADASVLGAITVYFAKAGAIVFGSGLAILPFLHGGVVRDLHWISERQFLDAIAVSMITPGPVVITVAFIGYLVAGPLGACAAAIGVFLPVYLMVVVVARWFHRVAGNPHLKAAVDGVTAAATGAIMGAVVVLGRRALIDVPTALICASTLAMVLWNRKIPEPVVLLAAGVLGILIHGAA